MNDEDELMFTNEILESILPDLKALTLSGVTSLICMIAEEWCALYHLDVVSYMEGVSDLIKYTNDKDGPY